MTTNTHRPTGRTDVKCLDCPWTHPAGIHTDHGTPQRPKGADYIDAAIPRIRLHIDATHHRVRVTISTFHTDRPTERSSMILGANGTGALAHTEWRDTP